MSLNVLLLEDNLDDAELIIHALRRADLDPVGRRVETEQDYSAALEDRPDIILADYNLPHFDALQALRLLQERALDIPFIVVTGSLEEQAVTCMKQGAVDYLLKDRLARLGEAVRNALKERDLRDQKRQAEAELRASEERFRRLAENVPDIIYRWRISPPGFTYVSPSVTTVLGYTPEQFYAGPEVLKEIIHPDDRPMMDSLVASWRRTEALTFRVIRSDGRIVWLEKRSTPGRDADGNVIGTEGIVRDITERVRAERQLQELKQFHEDIVQEMAEGIVLEQDGYFTFVNPAAARMLGYTPEELLGQPTTRILSPEHRCDQTHEVARGQLGDNGHFELELVRKDGSRFPVLVSIIPRLEQERRVGTMAVFTDITERQRIIAAERAQRTLAEALADTAAALSSTLELDKLLPAILDNVDRVVPHNGANIMLFEDDIARVVHSRGDYAPLELEEFTAFSSFATRDLPHLRQMVDNGTPVLIPDTRNAAGWVRREPYDWIRSYIGAPIHIGKEVIGFINLDNATPNSFAPGDAERLQAFANQAALAIQNAQLYARSRRRAEELEALRRVTLDITNQLDLEQLLHTLMESALQLLKTDSGGFYLYRPEQDFLERSHSIGATASPVGSIRRRGESFSGKVWEQGRPLIINNYREWNGQSELTHEGNVIRAVIGVPVRWGDQFLGVITAAATADSTINFSEDDAHLLTLFADQAAIALHNVRMYQEMENYNVFLDEAVSRRTADLRRTTEQIAAILTSSSDAILFLEPDGTIKTANPAVEELFGYDLVALREQQPHVLVTESSLVPLLNAVDATRRDGQKQRLEIVARHRDDTTFDADVALAPVYEGERVVGIVCSLRDISALKAVERMKDAFVSNVSHELRTPITSLSLAHGLITMHPHKQGDYLASMRREIDRLTLIIEDLLRLSRLDQERTVIKPRLIDVNSMARQYVCDRTALAASQGLTLALEEGPQQQWVEADEGLLGQVLSIFLTNAFNYTPAGGRVVVRTRSEHHCEGVWAGISVSDTGLGILPREQDRLFERFFRGQAGHESGAAGTGLGLPIAREIVERHHGRIEVESDGVPGRGTTFTVWLPTVAADKDRPLELNGSGKVSELARVRTTQVWQRER